MIALTGSHRTSDLLWLWTATGSSFDLYQVSVGNGLSLSGRHMIKLTSRDILIAIC